MGKTKFYSVVIGRIPGLYTTWEDCETQVSKYPGAIFKAFCSREEAHEYLVQHCTGVAISLPPIPPPATKKRKQFTESPLEIQKSSSPDYSNNNNVMVVYTDGACSFNDTTNPASRAGCGVWFGDNDIRNISTHLPGLKQTNQRAELYAAILALEVLPKDKPVEIRSDSKYTIKLAMRTYNAHDNIDLVQQLLTLIEQHQSCLWTYVPGHSTINDYNKRGNDGADQLARAGAKLLNDVLPVK